MEHVAQLQQGPNPTVLALNETAINKDDVVTANADNLLMAFSGTFSGTPADGLTETVLIKSSKRSQLVEAMMASFAAGEISRNFVPSGTEFPWRFDWPANSRLLSRMESRNRQILPNKNLMKSRQNQA